MSTSVLRRADAALKLGNASECEKIVRPLLEQDSNHVGGLEILAKAQWNLNLHESLLETLSALVKINPYEPGYHMLRGSSLRKLGRYGDAIRSFVRAGDADGAKEAVAEISALQSDLVLHLMRHDAIFKAHYSQDPEQACATRGFEFGSETKIRHWVLTNECPSPHHRQRPS